MQLVRLLNSHSALPSILQNNSLALVYAHTADTLFHLSLVRWSTDTLALSGELVAYLLGDHSKHYCRD